MTTTDAPMTMESLAEDLIAPIETPEETETEAQETPPETDEVEEETEADASPAVDEEDGEAEDDTDEVEDEADEADEDQEEASPRERLITVKVDGKEQQVTEQELKNDFSGRASLETRHKELKAQEELTQRQAAVIMQMYEQAQTQGFKPEPQMPDIQLRETDPIAYMEAKDNYDRQLMEYQQQQTNMAALQQHQQKLFEAQKKEHQEAEMAKLMEVVPAFADPEKRKAAGAAILETAKEFGYSQEDLNQIVDHRAVRMLHELSELKALKDKGEAAKVEQERAKPVTKKRAKARTDGKLKREQEMRRQAVKTQSVEDWAATLLE